MNFASTIYRSDISFPLTIYRCSDILLERYLSDISRIYRFGAHRFARYFADLSAINRENKARYSAIIACITFAQYCRIIYIDFQGKLKIKEYNKPKIFFIQGEWNEWSLILYASQNLKYEQKLILQATLS